MVGLLSRFLAERRRKEEIDLARKQLEAAKRQGRDTRLGLYVGGVSVLLGAVTVYFTWPRSAPSLEAKATADVQAPTQMVWTSGEPPDFGALADVTCADLTDLGDDAAVLPDTAVIRLEIRAPTTAAVNVTGIRPVIYEDPVPAPTAVGLHCADGFDPELPELLVDLRNPDLNIDTRLRDRPTERPLPLSIPEGELAERRFSVAGDPGEVTAFGLRVSYVIDGEDKELIYPSRDDPFVIYSGYSQLAQSTSELEWNDHEWAPMTGYRGPRPNLIDIGERSVGGVELGGDLARVVDYVEAIAGPPTSVEPTEIRDCTRQLIVYRWGSFSVVGALDDGSSAESPFLIGFDYQSGLAFTDPNDTRNPVTPDKIMLLDEWEIGDPVSDVFDSSHRKREVMNFQTGSSFHVVGYSQEGTDPDQDYIGLELYPDDDGGVEAFNIHVPNLCTFSG